MHTKTNVESLASLAGKVELRGYRWMNRPDGLGARWVEFAVTEGGVAWFDDGDGGIEHAAYRPEKWTFYLTPLSESAPLAFRHEGPAVIAAMREWAKDCAWRDLDDEDIDELPAAELLAGVARHFDGGIAAFLATM